MYYDHLHEREISYFSAPYKYCMIEVTNKTKSKIDFTWVKELAEKFLGSQKEKRDASIVFVGEARMRQLNKRYRKIDAATDVLAFSGDSDFLGEVIICHKQVARQGKIFKTGTRRELALVLVHGLLHLLGYEDENEKGRQQMLALAENFLRKNYD